MSTVRKTTIGALAFAALLLPMVAGGCGGGGGGGGGGPQEITVTISGCDTSLLSSDGIVCVSFTATGPAGIFDILAQFIAGPTGPIEGAYPVPPAILQDVGIVPAPVFTGLEITEDGGSVSGSFCWFVGADLGFVAATGLQLFLTPVEGGGTTPLGDPAQACLPSFNYPGGGSTRVVTGTAFTGRAAHTGDHAGANHIAISGGQNLGGIFDTFERFTINPVAFTFTKNLSTLAMTDQRVDHASSFFLDPSTHAIKVLSTGGSDARPISGLANNTADVFSFTPTEHVQQTTGDMILARRGHTATWIPENKVAIIGGHSPVVPVDGTDGSTSDHALIEVYDPVSDAFTLLADPPTHLNFPRSYHTATLLANGKVLIAGGYSASSPATALPAELFDPATGDVSVVHGTELIDRQGHTATRLANGWVLLAGGASLAGGLQPHAHIFMPELGTFGEFTSTLPVLNTQRAFHAAGLLGDGNVLVTGGVTPVPAATASAEAFLYAALAFTPTVSMDTARFDHSMNAIDGGSMVVIGGRNEGIPLTDGPTFDNFLSSIEVYPFENTNPTVSAFTGTSPGAGQIYVAVEVTDEDADGGYVIIRYRLTSGNSWHLCTITQQNPSTAPSGFPNMHVYGKPVGQVPVMQYSFLWNFLADGLGSGNQVEVEVLPVGATLGTPARFLLTLP